MRKFVILSLFAMASLTAGCGSSSPAGSAKANITGPELSVAEAKDLLVNQFYVKEWSGEGNTIHFNIYIQDDLNENFIVCAGPDEGLNTAVEAGVYYASLSAGMLQVDSVDYNAVSLNIIITADQDNPCPAPPDEGKIVVTASGLSLDDIYNNALHFENDSAIIGFIGRGGENISVEQIPVAEDNKLIVGEISFRDSPDASQLPTYYLVLYFADGSGVHMISSGDMPEMRESGVVYSWLNLPFDDVTKASFTKEAWVELKRVRRADSPITVGTTESVPIEDMHGHRLNFTNGSGYIIFKDIN